MFCRVESMGELYGWIGPGGNLSPIALRGAAYYKEAMENYADKETYIRSLDLRGTAPLGFRFAISSLEFHPAERETKQPLSMNLSAAVLDSPTESFAGVYTRNQFPGAPVIIGRERLSEASTSGVLVNNRIANVCATGGEEHARKLSARFARILDRSEHEIFPASTGIIGWGLPVDEMTAALGPLATRLGSDTPTDMARGIMTTDSFPKLRSANLGSGRIVGVAKGAGMIEPNLATLLVFLFTDITIGRSDLQECLARAVHNSFNAISVDSDQSTSDTVLAFSSNRQPTVDIDTFTTALTQVCYDLSLDVVRNGEGTEHVIRVHVGSAPDEEIARGCAKAVVNSPLVKTAICGNDPNVGRIIGAVGDFAGSYGISIDRKRVRVSIGDENVFADGVFALDPERENRLADYLVAGKLGASEDGYPAHDRNVEIFIELGDGDASGEAVGSDLTHGYVAENADYRS